MNAPTGHTSSSRSLSELRSTALNALSNETFDLAIIGGGITGAGIARDAALRGLKVALLEKMDFGSGTSSKSSKLVHGGLRYLENGDLRLVFESVNERNFLIKKARHLVRPLDFMLPNYRGDRRWLSTLDFGVWLYEALCLFRTPSGRLHETVGRKRALELEPQLRSDDLNGCVIYSDAQTDDARLTLENVIDARERGAIAVNHLRAGALLRTADGRVTGLQAKDLLGEGTLDVRAKVVVNASGPWSDEVRVLLGKTEILKPARGSHIVVDSKRLPLKHALMTLAPRDQRVVFCIPWGPDRTIVGTTDTFYEGELDDVYATADDVAYLLETANRYLPSAKLQTEDVISTWSGLRPLIKPEDNVKASKVSREHLLESVPGFVTIAGGKLTTYRRMAQELVDLALKEQLEQPQRASTTSQSPLPGAVGLDSENDLLTHISALKHLGEDVAKNLVAMYGARSQKIAERGLTDAGAATRIDPALPFLFAQVDEAVEHELAVTLDDVLSRRVPFLLRSRDQGLSVADAVAQRMAARLSWSDARVAKEIAGYRAVVERSRRFRQ